MAKVASSMERLNELFDADPRNDSSIADALGVSKQTISAWRKGIRSPKASKVAEIARAYGVPEEWIYGWDMDRPQFVAVTAQMPTRQDVMGMLDSVEGEALEKDRERKHQNELKLLRIFRSITAEGQEYLLQQADIAMRMFAE